MDWQIPVGRGFNASFGFLGGGEDHISQNGMLAEWGCHGTDLWSSHGPAIGKNGTYSGYIYNDAAVAVIEQHLDPESNPLFIYLATQTMHAPLEVPSCFSDLYPNTTYTYKYAVSQGMATVSDSVLANVSAVPLPDLRLVFLPECAGKSLLPAGHRCAEGTWDVEQDIGRASL